MKIYFLFSSLKLYSLSSNFNSNSFKAKYMKYLIKLEPSQINYYVQSDISILASSKLQNVHLEYGCQKGDCGNCKAQLIAGAVKLVNGEEVHCGHILTCMSYPISDITLLAKYLPELEGIKEVNLPCKVSNIKVINQQFVILTLRIPSNTNFKFLPGQYIDLSYQGVTRSYSIASLLSNNQTFDLHIRLFDKGQFSHLLKNININQVMRFSGPKGSFFIRESNRPILFLASGTGFAPIHAMIQDLIEKNETRDIFVYWRMRKASYFYLDNPFSDDTISKINFVPYIFESDINWHGRVGSLYDNLTRDFQSLENFVVYACGSVGFIEEAKSVCQFLNLNESYFYTDSFIPA